MPVSSDSCCRMRSTRQVPWLGLSLRLEDRSTNSAINVQNWLVRSASEVETNIVSVERILHYIALEPEAPAEIPNAVPEHWPTKGEIEFKDYCVRYRPELDLALKNISIKIVSQLSSIVPHEDSPR